MTERQVAPRLKSAKKKPKTPTKTQQLKKADALFGRIIRARGRCQHCGKTTDLQCAHGFSRRYRATRWDEDNAFCLCRGCHLFFTHRPLEWEEWMLMVMHRNAYALLRQRAMGPNPDLSETVARLQERWAQIESEAA